MTPRAIEAGVVSYLRRLAADAKPHTGQMRAGIGCTVAELRAVVEGMRFKGKLQFDRLALSASMQVDAPDIAGDSPEPVGCATVAGESTEAGSLPPGPVDAPGDEAGEDDVAVAAAEAKATSSDGAVSDNVGETPGALLLRAIEIYCRATGTLETRVGKMLCNYPGFVGLLRKRGTVAPDKIERVRALIAEYPQGLPASDDVAAPVVAVDDAVDRFLQQCTIIDVRTTIRASLLYEMFCAWAAASGTPDRSQKAFAHEMRARGFKLKLSDGHHWIGLEAVAVADAEPAHVAEVAPRSDATGLADLAPLSPVEAIQSLIADTPEDLIQSVGRVHPQLWRRCVLFGRMTEETPAATLYRALAAGLAVLEDDLNEEVAGG